MMGHDILTSQEAGQANQSIPDDQILAFACAEQRAILTYNRKHLIRLYNSQSSHAGIIVCTVDPDPIELAVRINDAIELLPKLEGQLVRITRPAN
jgi:Domain of unknown function (DUF5615)